MTRSTRATIWLPLFYFVRNKEGLLPDLRLQRAHYSSAIRKTLVFFLTLHIPIERASKDKQSRRIPLSD